MTAIAFLVLFPLLLIFLTAVAFYAALSTPAFVTCALAYVGYRMWKARHV